MDTLKEFANFIIHNKATLAATYARLLGERSEYKDFTPESRLAGARKLLKAVTEACQAENFEPLVSLFAASEAEGGRRWPAGVEAPQPMVEIECLGQTLTPVVTNLEAGKFLWQMLAEGRRLIFQAPRPFPAASLPADATNSDRKTSASLSPPEALPPAAEEESDPEAPKEYSLLQILIDKLPDYIYIKDVESRFLLVNQATANHLGATTTAEVTGRTDFDFSPPDLAEQYYEDEQQLLGTGQALIGHEEPIFDHETGRQKWVLTTKVPFRDSQGQIAGLVGMSRDITALKEAHEALHIRTRAIEASIDPISIADARQPDLPLVYVNPAFEQVTGYTTEEIVGRNCRFLQGLDRNQPGLDELRAALQEGRACTVVVRNYRKDGSLFWNELQVSPVYDEQGLLTHFIGVQNDITKRKQTQDDLSKLAANLETVIEVGVAISTILDPEVLLQTVADSTKERFGLYHAHIYLLDEPGETLELVAGAGDVGRRMTGEGWRIPLERKHSLVARTARTRQGRIVNDVREEPDFMANPLLPATRSELAAPLMVKDEVLGVLDVQSETVDYFTEEDLRIQKTLAGAIAVALQNARLYEQTRQAAVEQENLVAQLDEQRLTLEAILQHIPVGVFVVRAPDGDRLLSNPYAEALLGPGIAAEGDVENLAALYDQVYHYDTDQPYTLEEWPLVQALAGESTSVDDMEVRRPNGSNVLLQVSGAPIRNAQGELTSSVAVFQDITGRKQTEHLLAKRAAQLEAVAQVSAATSTILETDKLLQTVVDLTKEQFDLYHAHIYLLDEPGEMLDLTAGAGEAGRQMVAEGWRIPLAREHSLVARAARLQQGSIVNDVRQEPDFMPNPLLPATRSELAVPLISKNQVLGVLDVQSDRQDHFTGEDLRIQTTLAGQIAVALENARLFEQMDRRTRREQTIREVTERVRAATSLEELVKTASEELGRRFSADYAAVELGIAPPSPPPAGGDENGRR